MKFTYVYPLISQKCTWASIKPNLSTAALNRCKCMQYLSVPEIPGVEPGFFLGEGAPLRKGVSDWSSQGGRSAPPVPSPRSALGYINRWGLP